MVTRAINRKDTQLWYTNITVIIVKAYCSRHSTAKENAPFNASGTKSFGHMGVINKIHFVRNNAEAMFL